jgi:hypothetical protein
LSAAERDALIDAADSGLERGEFDT